MTNRKTGIPKNNKKVSVLRQKILFKITKRHLMQNYKKKYIYNV